MESAVFASDLDRTMQEADDALWVSKRMEELDRQISSLLFCSRDAPLVSQMAPQPESVERMTSKTMRDFAEIKLHT